MASKSKKKKSSQSAKTAIGHSLEGGRDNRVPDGLLQRMLQRKSGGKGKVSLAALPALVDEYQEMLETVFRGLNRPGTPEGNASLKRLLREAIERVYQVSSYGTIWVEYETLGSDKPGAVAFSIREIPGSMADVFDQWLQHHGPPHFGALPDARLMDLVGTLGEPGFCPVLDIGAGSGRNSLPLARLGYPVTAIEPSPSLAEILRNTAHEKGLRVELKVQDLFGPNVKFENRYRVVILSEVVTHFRGIEELRKLFAKAHEALVPGGYLLLSGFLPLGDFEPDARIRQIAESQWSSLFTRGDYELVSQGLPFELVSNESVIEYEKAHLPLGAFPQTSWFVNWAEGGNVFFMPGEKRRMDLRWLLFQKRGGPRSAG